MCLALCHVPQIGTYRNNKTMKKIKFGKKDHTYWFEGKRVTGVTSSLQMFSPGQENLDRWAANRIVKKYTQEIRKLGLGIKVKDLEKIEKMAKEEAINVRDNAARHGKRIHKEFSKHAKEAIKGSGYFPAAAKDEDPEVNALIKFLRKEKIKMLKSDYIVFDEDRWFAGTLDLYVQYKKKRYVVDLKTGYIGRKAFAQTAAYAIAIKNEAEPVDGLMVISTKKVKDRRVKRIVEKEDIKVSMNIARDYALFVACLEAYRNFDLVDLGA